MSLWDESHALEWRRSFGPPARPTLAESRVYGSQMTKLNPSAKILLLGSTPEIRDAASRFDLHITVVDFDEKNYKESQSLMGHNAEKEVYVNKNWTEIDFKSEFDLVLSDNILSVVTPSDAKKIIKKVHASLKPGGKWVTRIMLYEIGQDFVSPDTLVGEISRCKTKKEMYENLYVPFITYYKNEVGKVILSEIYDKIKRDVGRGLFPIVCIEVFNSIRYYDKESYLVERDDFEKFIYGMYDIEKMINHTEKFSNNWVIYVLVKK